eukprot:2106170-Ditylum_brightwellii.AAC.1
MTVRTEICQIISKEKGTLYLEAPSEHNWDNSIKTSIINHKETKEEQEKNQPVSIMSKTNLQALFELNRNDEESMKKFDVDALIREVRQNPPSIEQRYDVGLDHREAIPREGRQHPIYSPNRSAPAQGLEHLGAERQHPIYKPILSATVYECLIADLK